MSITIDDLKNFDIEATWNKFLSVGFSLLGKIVLFFVILIIGFWITGLIERKMISRRKISLVNPTMQSFFRSFLRIGMRVGVVMMAVTAIGVESGSIVAVIGSAGLAIGLALQGSLSNLSSGVLILTNKPFEVDHFVEFNQFSGTVMSIGLFYTRLRTADGKAIYVPNSTMTTTTLINYSLYPVRRMDIQFGVAYGTDMEKLRSILMSIAGRHQEIHDDPSPIVAVIDFAAYSLTVRFRFFVDADRYWDLYHEIYKEILDALVREGVEIPFPRYVVSTDGSGTEGSAR